MLCGHCIGYVRLQNTHTPSAPPLLQPLNGPVVLHVAVHLVRIIRIARLPRTRRVDVEVDANVELFVPRADVDNVPAPNEHVALVQLHRLPFAVLVERVDGQLGPVLQCHNHDEVRVSPRRSRRDVRVWPAGIRVQRRLFGCRGVVVVAIHTRLERVRADHPLTIVPRRRREPVEPGGAERLQHALLGRLHPRRIRLVRSLLAASSILAASRIHLADRLPTVPPIAHPGRTWDRDSLLVEAAVEDALERRLIVDR
mmetsp:Transcript_31578/g.92988  ORF Transcript_31578/g.92988 Transcript_31578/m.92988 type:complete len:255 (-) Transcript_31578:629-1393(-)